MVYIIYTHIIYMHSTLFVQFTGNDCPQIPSPTNNSIKVAEHSDQTFDFTIKGEVYTVMNWCFAGSDHHNKVCCYCNIEEECPMADWTIDYYRHEGSCYHYTCSLTIHKVSMNYSDGTLISGAAESSGNISKNVNYTRILVTQNNNKHTSPPLPVCFAITGIGIIAAVIVVVISAMYVIRRRCHWSSSYYMHNDYENIPSSSPCKLRPYLLYSYICDWICEKGSYTRLRFCNFNEA